VRRVELQILPPVSAADRVESLPADYRQHAVSPGGGRLAENSTAVKVVFTMSDTAPEWARISEALETYEDRLPGWLTPVARDEFGNLFCLSIRRSDGGSIWFWDHELEADEGEAPRLDNINRVADNWTQFLNGLTPLP
jgi:hypothetical protein